MTKSKLRSAGRSCNLTVLGSPDSLRDIYDFYAGELERAGRIATSNLVSEASATIVARHGPYGITISINETGMGTAVSIGAIEVGDGCSRTNRGADQA